MVKRRVDEILASEAPDLSCIRTAMDALSYRNMEELHPELADAAMEAAMQPGATPQYVRQFMLRMHYPDAFAYWFEQTMRHLQAAEEV